MDNITDLLQKLIDDDSGVSPVIGVILMVAVTVIIAAIIGSSALGLGESVSETPPQAQFSAEITGEWDLVNDDRDETYTFDRTILLEHEGGENVDPSNIQVTIDGEPVQVHTDIGEGRGYSDFHHVATPWYDTDTVSSGDSTRILTVTSKIEDAGLSIDPISEDRVIYATNQDGDGVVYSPDGPFDGDNNIPNSESNIGPGEHDIKVIWESNSQSQILYEDTV